MSAGSVWLDFSRTVVIAQAAEEVAWFVHQLEGREQLAGYVVEKQPRRDVAARWRRRISRNGARATASVFAAQLLDRLADRAGSVRHGLGQTRPPADHLCLQTTNVNEPSVARWVTERAPTLVVVVGTRIIRPPLLTVISRPVALNLHAGLTPAYRGTHGGAWALLRGRPEDVASTWHIIDEGIDTGRPVAFVPVEPASTLGALARRHRDGGLRWLDEQSQSGRVEVVPPRPPPTGDLLYPPTLREWLRFRRAFAAFAAERGKSTAADC